MIIESRCIQCQRTADEIGHPAILLLRQRPMRNGSYQICLACAQQVRQEQEARR